MKLNPILTPTQVLQLFDHLKLNKVTKIMFTPEEIVVMYCPGVISDTSVISAISILRTRIPENVPVRQDKMTKCEWYLLLLVEKYYTYKKRINNYLGGGKNDK